MCIKLITCIKKRGDAGEVPRFKVKLRRRMKKVERSVGGFSRGAAIRIVYSVRLLERDEFSGEAEIPRGVNATLKLDGRRPQKLPRGKNKIYF